MESDEVEHGGEVVLTQLDEAVVPVLLLVCVGVPALVLTAVGRASVVAEPDVVAVQGEEEAGRQVRVVGDPAVGGA